MYIVRAQIALQHEDIADVTMFFVHLPSFSLRVLPTNTPQLD